MARNYKSKQSLKQAKKDEKTCQMMEELEIFEEWKKSVLPELREMLLNKMTAEQIAKKYAAHAVARAVTIATTSTDEKAALSACKDIIDRAHGKPTETQKHVHEFDQMSEQDLNAVIKSQLEGLGMTIIEEGDEEDEGQTLQ